MAVDVAQQTNQMYRQLSNRLDTRFTHSSRIRHVDRKHLNNRIEADHAALKQLLRPKRNFRKLASAKNTLKGIETYRAIKGGHFANNQPGVLNEIAFVENLFKTAA